jgi:hypothetical protein
MIVLTVWASPFSNTSAASSPPFSYHQISDPLGDWKEFYSGADVNGTASTDILEVSFFSDGEFLYTTLWLDGTFEIAPARDPERVSYGVFIDADANRNTGPNGIDYKLELTLYESVWTKEFEQWSSIGETRLLENTTISQTSENNSTYFAEGQRFVNLSLDLAAVGSPERYRVLFYSEWKGPGGRDFYTDVTNWVNYPPPKFVISTVPSALSLKQGEEANLEVQLRSTSDIEPTVILSPRQTQSNVIESFEFDPPQVRVPPNGIATSHLHIKISDAALPAPHTVLVITNSTFSQGSIFSKDFSELRLSSNGGGLGEAVSKADDENVIEATTFLITVDKASSPDEILLGWYTKYGAIAGTIIGFLGVAKPVREKMILFFKRIFVSRAKNQSKIPK